MVDGFHIFSYENKINYQKRLPAKFNFNFGKMTYLRLPKSLTFSVFFSSSLSLSPTFFMQTIIWPVIISLFSSYPFLSCVLFCCCCFFFSHCLVSDSCIALCFSLAFFKKFWSWFSQFARNRGPVCSNINIAV